VPANTTEIAREIAARHAAMPGAMLPVLHALQAEFGYLPKETLPVVADVLNVSRAEVYGVATFYHDFCLEPRGTHTIALCRAEACQAMGGRNLAEQVRARLGVGFGETTGDGGVTLEQTFCLGLCASAPAAMVNGTIVGRLTEAKVDALLSEMGR
jgi:formate dehydrogenase subunit gamma